jgi:hypothetical protein
MRVVSTLNDLVNSLELQDGHDWSENFLLGNGHVVANIGENGGLNEPTLVAHTFTTSDKLGTLFLANINVVHNFVELLAVDLRTLVGVSTEWISYLSLGGDLSRSLNELVVDLFLNEESATGNAALALVEEETDL